MASSSIFPFLFISLYFFTFFFKSLIADSNTSFSLKTIGKNSNNDSFLALYGDAKLVNGGFKLQLTVPSPYSVGRVIYKKPISIYGGIPKKSVSISTYFSFLISNRNRLGFVVFPDRNRSAFSVEFEEHIGIDKSRFMSVKVMNLSSVNLVINGSEKMQSWIDYEPGSKRLEVRLNRCGENRPLDPILFVEVDFLKIWPKNERVFVGLSSSNGNSSKMCYVDSWRFKASRAPDWMHSRPLDPMGLKVNQEHEIKVVSRETNCVMKILGALILGIGFGCFGTFVVIIMFTVFGNRSRQPILPEEFVVKSLQEYEHKN